MAKKQHVLLESIFNTSSVIEEAITANWDHHINPPPKTILGKIKKELGARKDTLKLAMAHGGIRDVGKELKNMAKDDLWNAGYTMKKGAKYVAKKSAVPGLVGLAGAAGAYALHDKIDDTAYALHNKLSDAADEAGEHINSLRDKLANIIAAHHEA